MHLVFVTSLVPDGHPSTGYEIANAAVIAALRRAGVRVSVVGYVWPGKVPADPENTVVLGEVDPRTDSAPLAQKLRWLAGAMASGLTFASAKLRVAGDAGLRDALRRLEPYDAYVLNAAQMAGAFLDVLSDRPFIFVAHNVEYLSAQENAATLSGYQRLLYEREARILRSVEERLCRQARFVFTFADDDRAPLGVAADDRAATLPLVTRDAVPPRSGPRETDCDAAMIGTWTWQPNRVGLEWYLDEVAPRLPSGFRTRVAGSIPSGMRKPPAGVAFVGRVPDATALVRSGRTVPLVARAGTGVQLKTIETFELGLPSVATSRALRGVSHLPDNCVVADEPQAFADALAASAASSTDTDGSAFHRAQILAMDAGVSRGLERLLPPRREVAA